MPESDRVSIWSIASDWRVVFYILFSIEVTVIVALVGWREIFQVTDDAPIETVLAIGTASAPNIFTAAAINIALIFQAEAIGMLLERYKRHRYEVGKAEGKAEGVEEGRMQGKAQERARNRRYINKLSAWYEERIEAEAKGEPFDEPMPELDDEDDDEMD